MLSFQYTSRHETRFPEPSKEFKECHSRCVGELDRWEGSQKHNSYLI